MAGILVQLIVSWLIIWFFEKNDLGVLGLYPATKRMTGFAVFFLVTALCCASGFFMRMLFAGQHWELNPQLTTHILFTGIWWNIKSVIFEELIFRGVVLYILVKKLGHSRAIFISAIAFGIYHWFSHEVLGNPVQMLITFLITGTMGLVYAYAYSKTFSIFYPIAIHLGWNLTGSVIFSNSVLGNQLLIPVQPVPDMQVGYFIYFCIMFVPLIAAILVNYFMLSRRKQEPMVLPRSFRNQ